MTILRRSTHALLGLLAFGTCGSAVPPPGTEVEGSFGAGARAYTVGGGCGTAPMRQESSELAGHAAVTHRLASGWTVASEVGGAHQAQGAGPRQGQADTLGLLSLRGGYHGSHGGIELGPGVLALEQGEQRGLLVVPVLSARTWAGEPKVLYVWGRFLSGTPSWVALPVGAGLGHAGDRFGMELGMVPVDGRTPDQPIALHAETSFRATPNARLGLMGDYRDEDTYRAAVTFTYAVPLASE